MVEAVGHADGDLVPVVERLEPRVRIARPDCPEDVGTPASDLPGRFDDFGDAAAGRPGHPMLQFAPPARPIGRPSKPRRSSSSCRAPPTAPMRRPRRTRGSRRAASWRPAPPSSSRNPGAANGARRRPGHNHVVSARSASSAAPPSRRAHGPRARAQDAAGRRRSSRTRRPCL